MEGQPFLKNGKTLLSGIDPVHRADKTADAVVIKDRTLYFCPSPIYGYGLARLLSRIEKESPLSAVLCVEADPELYELSLKNIDASLFAANKMRLTNIFDSGKLISFIRSEWGALAFRRAEIIRFSGGWQLFKELYDSLFEQLKNEIANDWSNALTLAKMGRLYIRNAVRNLNLLTRYGSISELSFGMSNALVLGAGPSLDEALDALGGNNDSFKKITGRGYKIICVDTCLGSLKDRGIIPDLVVILESQHWNLRDFIGCLGWDVPAAVDLCSLPASANLLSKRSFLFMTPWTSLNIFDRLKKRGLLPSSVPPLGSVGLTAVEIAGRLCGGNIICAGLDFSFTQDKYHARSTPGHRSALIRQNRFKRLSNTAAYNSHSFAAFSKSGVSVYSSPIMCKYRDLFEQEFGGDSRIFDIEGTGLPLGIKTLSMEDAIVMLEKRNFDREPARANMNRRCGMEVKACDVSGKKNELEKFYEDEKERLIKLRAILTGEAAADETILSNLLDECDYLWAHFPDYSGGRKAKAQDISFLKRVRAELDLMIDLFERLKLTLV